jgi:hypothetical protein
MSRPVSSGTYLREIQNVTARMKKARKLISTLRQTTARENDWAKAADISLDAAKAAGTLVGSLTPELADPDMLLKLVQMQRFATSLLVRARRIKTALGSEGGLSRLADPGEYDSDNDHDNDDLAGEE